MENKTPERQGLAAGTLVNLGVEEANHSIPDTASGKPATGTGGVLVVYLSTCLSAGRVVSVS